MVPYEYRLVKSRVDGDSIIDALCLIKERFGVDLRNNQIEKSDSRIEKNEGHFYKTSTEVGFTLLKSKKSFIISIFALDLDGTADGIETELKVTSDYVFIIKNHPYAFLKIFSKCPVEVEVIKVKDESNLSSFETSKHKEYLSEMINPIHIQDDSIQKYSDEFFEKSILILDNFFAVSFNFDNVETWPRAGPADYRSFKYNLKDDEISSFMNSKEFITWLSSVTGLPLLHPAVPIYTRCLQSAGDYQILHGNYSEPLGLDVIYSNYPSNDFKEWPETVCGRIHYLNNSGDEILQVNPVNNSLTIVYRTEGCSRFTENIKGIPEIPLFQTIGIYSVAEDE